MKTLEDTPPTTEKTCTKCGITKSLTNFNKNGYRKDGTRKFKTQCKPCSVAYTSQWIDSNRDKVEEYRRINSETRKAKKRQWRLDNLEHVRNYQCNWRAENTEHLREYERVRVRRDPYSCQARNAARRARKRRAFVEYVSIHALRDRDGDDCCICHSPIDFTLKDRDPMMVSLEHVVPLSRGGEHSYANTALSHLRCNLSKGAKTLDEVHESTYAKEAV